MMDSKQHPASYRDPAGFIFEFENKFYRQVNQLYAAQYEFFKTSGLYDLLLKEKKILAHTEIDKNFTDTATWYKTLLPEQLGFISYPYEWCFGQWKDAALLTLNILKISIEHQMILKDATPFNIQFTGNKPVFIDTLSFEKYDASKPWVAYRQFIECFIAPLLLAKYTAPDFLKIFQLYPDGIPLAALTKLLPFKSRFNLNVLLHIFLPTAISTQKKSTVNKNILFTKKQLLNIIHNLELFVRSIKLTPHTTSWNNYYQETVLSNAYVAEKKSIIKEWMQQLPIETVLDLGTNTGLFAEMTAAEGKFTIAVDGDIACIDKLYKASSEKKIRNLLALSADITNPSPAIGWNNSERTALLQRIKTDLCMALALVHHLSISKHIEFDQMAATFSDLSTWLIIEFVPKTDEKVLLLLKDREDIFLNYNEASFIDSFQKKFILLKRQVLENTGRVLFLMKRK